jgi:hypothetical protein
VDQNTGFEAGRTTTGTEGTLRTGTGVTDNNGALTRERFSSTSISMSASSMIVRSEEEIDTEVGVGVEIDVVSVFS